MGKVVVCGVCGSNVNLELYEQELDFGTNQGTAVFYCSRCDAGTRVKFEIVNIKEM